MKIFSGSGRVSHPTSEEEATPAPDRTKDWVHESKFEGLWKEDPQQDNIDQRVYKSVTFDVASGQPPNNVQTMKVQQIIPQQTNQYQHGYSVQITLI